MGENTWPKMWENWFSSFRRETRSERYYSAHYVMHRLQFSGYTIFPGPEQSDFAIYIPPPQGPAWILFRQRSVFSLRRSRKELLQEIRTLREHREGLDARSGCPVAAVFRTYYALGPGVSHVLARLLDEEAERQGVTLLQWLRHRP